ncbi:MAG: hypothetical protein ACK5N9_11185, partial [Pirellula sp.]
MRKILLLSPLLLTLVITYCNPHQSMANENAVSVAQAFREWLDAECQRHPMFATQQGMREYDGQMDDLSPEARLQDTQRDQEVLTE